MKFHGQKHLGRKCEWLVFLWVVFYCGPHSSFFLIPSLKYILLHSHLFTLPIYPQMSSLLHLFSLFFCFVAFFFFFFLMITRGRFLWLWKEFSSLKALSRSTSWFVFLIAPKHISEEDESSLRIVLYHALAKISIQYVFNFHFHFYLMSCSGLRRIMSLGLQHIIIELKSTKDANLIPGLWNFMAKIPSRKFEWLVSLWVVLWVLRFFFSLTFFFNI